MNGSQGGTGPKVQPINRLCDLPPDVEDGAAHIVVIFIDGTSIDQCLVVLEDCATTKRHVHPLSGWPDDW